jgi:hypothetical protein
MESLKAFVKENPVYALIAAVILVSVAYQWFW